MEQVSTGAKTGVFKIHPHKFAMWLAIGTIAMMFAGFTSAYIVQKAQVPWRHFSLPSIFYVSTVLIIVSSLTLHMAVKSYKAKNMPAYKIYILLTLVLGTAFGICQLMGFNTLNNLAEPVRVSGNPSEGFLFIITGTHLLHILGGVLALLIVSISAFIKSKRSENSVGLEVISYYWHFVDILWIYLFIFFLVNQ